MRVLICAGGTGGGIYPALAAASELRRLGLSHDQLVWLGTRGEMEETLVPRAGIQLKTVPGGPVIGVSLSTKILNVAKLVSSMSTTSGLIRRLKPRVMLLTGGYLAVPAALTAWLHRLPIVAYLPDVEPASAIRIAQRFASTIACTSEDSAAFLPPEKFVVTGYPVRPELREATALTRSAALSRFDLKPGRRTLFVFGGSRGARSINMALQSVLPRLLQEIQVIHISGTLTWPQVEQSAAGLDQHHRAYYRAYPYLHKEMGPAFRAADLVLARAGASMMGECPAFGLPAILVPYPHAWRYQKVNAAHLTDRGAAVTLPDEQLPEKLADMVLDLLHDEQRLSRMAAAAKSLDKPNAAAELAKLVLATGNRPPRGVAA